MEIIEKRFDDEFWGQKFYSFEYEINESYKNEVYEMIVDKIFNNEFFNIKELDSFEIKDDDNRSFFIDAKDFLTDEQIKDIERLLI